MGHVQPGQDVVGPRAVEFHPAQVRLRPGDKVLGDGQHVIAGPVVVDVAVGQLVAILLAIVAGRVVQQDGVAFIGAVGREDGSVGYLSRRMKHLPETARLRHQVVVYEELWSVADPGRIAHARRRSVSKQLQGSDHPVRRHLPVPQEPDTSPVGSRRQIFQGEGHPGVAPGQRHPDRLGDPLTGQRFHQVHHRRKLLCQGAREQFQIQARLRVVDVQEPIQVGPDPFLRRKSKQGPEDGFFRNRIPS